MPNHTLSHRAFLAVAVVPFAAALACSSGAKSDTSPEPARPEADTSASVRNRDGKTTENLFVGRFPGVNVTTGPNGGIQIRIRGGSGSGYTSDEPLYVVDETPLPSGTGGIIMVSPNDIERIEVLKNPADIAVYGSRGANGVVKITTKRPGRR